MENLPLLIFFHQTSHRRLCSLLVVSVISLRQEQKNKGAGSPFVGWCMIITRQKNTSKYKKLFFSFFYQALVYPIYLLLPELYAELFSRHASPFEVHTFVAVD